MQQLAERWRDDYAAMIVDMARLMRPSSRGPETTKRLCRRRTTKRAR